MLVFVTGMPGSGKSTLCEEFARRGYDAVDTDEEVCAWVDRQTGVKVAEPPAFPDRTPEFYETNVWRYQRDELEVLGAGHAHGVCLVVGYAAGEREVHPLFASRYFLQLAADELERRLMTRTNGVFATASLAARRLQIERVLPTLGQMEATWRAHGLEPVDARLPVDRVADDILARCRLPRAKAGR